MERNKPKEIRYDLLGAKVVENLQKRHFDAYYCQTKEDALKMFKETNVDGVMVGRGALGNPWIFRDIIQYLQGEEILKITNNEKLQIMLEHINLEVKEKGENVAIKEMRKHISYYIKNLPNATIIRNEINKIDKQDELVACLTEYFNKL